MPRPKTSNLHIGSSFDDFLEEEGIVGEVTGQAVREVIAQLVIDHMERANLTKTEMAARMHTSRQALARLLDAKAGGVTLDTLERAASAVGKRVRISFDDVAAQKLWLLCYSWIRSQSQPLVAVMVINEPGTLGTIATVVGDNGANIDRVDITAQSPDFHDIVLDLEVWGLKQLNTIMAELRGKPVVSKVERVDGQVEIFPEAEMITVGASEARTYLSALLELVDAGEDVVISRRGKPVARLVSVREVQLSRVNEAFKKLKALRKGTTLESLLWKELRDEGRP